MAGLRVFLKQNDIVFKTVSGDVQYLIALYCSVVVSMLVGWGWGGG